MLFLVVIFISGNCSENYEVVNNVIKFHEPSTLSNLDCSWRITVPENKSVVATFKDFHIEASTECQNGFITFFDGANETENNGIGERLCGNTIPDDIATIGNELFISMKLLEITGVNFELHYDVASKF